VARLLGGSATCEEAEPPGWRYLAEPSNEGTGLILANWHRLGWLKLSFKTRMGASVSDHPYGFYKISVSVTPGGDRLA